MAQQKRKRVTTAPNSRTLSISRPLYWDTIREVIARGEISEMKRLVVAARTQSERYADLKRDVGQIHVNLKRAIVQLEKAIRGLEK